MSFLGHLLRQTPAGGEVRSATDARALELKLVKLILDLQQRFWRTFCLPFLHYIAEALCSTTCDLLLTLMDVQM